MSYNPADLDLPQIQRFASEVARVTLAPAAPPITGYSSKHAPSESVESMDELRSVQAVGPHWVLHQTWVRAEETKNNRFEEIEKITTGFSQPMEDFR